MTEISILTYNILSSNLAELMINEKKNDKPVYDKSYMNTEYRWNKISTYLKNKIREHNNKIILCLQEVTEDWCTKFTELFKDLDYSNISVQHGKIFNGNMGVLIAYPNFLTIKKSEFYHVGKHILVTSEYSKLAATRNNIAILTIFENISTNFTIGLVTYHMPCFPTVPYVAFIHSKVLYKKVVRFMGDNKWIWAGDFNMTPDTKSYKYLHSYLKCVWYDCKKKYSLTNHSYINGFEFKGCIDYIFYSKNNIKCIDVHVLNINNILPDKYNSSDHIPIIAKFIFN